jgi:type II secretory pathway pseudopilin PulG
MTRLATHSKRSGATGFTIVETMIVLAIAGLILLIVFQAIPVLIRNGRNNQRRQDVQTILGAVSHWELNNSGNVPNTPGDDFLTYVQSKLTAYTYNTTYTYIHSKVETPGVTLTSVNHDPDTDPDQVFVYNYQKCSGGGSTYAGAGYSDVVALYAVEGGNGMIPQCEQL